MSTLVKWIIGLSVALIAGLILYFNWSRIMNFLKGNTKTDGTPCSTTGGIGSNNNGTYLNGICVAKVPEGSPCKTTPNNHDGTIIGGVCVVNSHPTPSPIATSGNIKIINPNGTRGLILQGVNFVSSVNAPLIPYGTTLAYTSYTKIPKTYYQTAQGWIDGDDAFFIN